MVCKLLFLVVANLVVLACGVQGQQNGELFVSTRRKFDDNNANNNNNKILSSDPPTDLMTTTTTTLNHEQIVKVQYVNVNGLPVLVQFTYVGPPKILPIATADSYPEGSSINLICTVSGGQRKGLVLSWMMNGEELDNEKLKYSGMFDNVSIGTDDADISIMKIKNATSANSGTYTCTAKNPLGQDSTSVRIVINGN